MNRIRHLAYILGGLVLSMLALGSTPAFAQNVPPPGRGDGPIGPQHITTHLVTAGGMPGWQITLIAVGAALAAATVAVLADRARTAHKQAPASAG